MNASKSITLDAGDGQITLKAKIITIEAKEELHLQSHDYADLVSVNETSVFSAKYLNLNGTEKFLAGANEVNIEANTKMLVTGPEIKIEGPDFKLEGNTVNINGKSKTDIKGGIVDING